MYVIIPPGGFASVAFSEKFIFGYGIPFSNTFLINMSAAYLPSSVVILFWPDLDEKFHVALRNSDFFGQDFFVCPVMRESDARNVFDHTEILTDAVFVPIRHSRDWQKQHKNGSLQWTMRLSWLPSN
jgi:hypothetical protein